ncbi:rhomboid family intramembrane serine protease [Georgenia sp. TF02-10]|uniref:rhomboid family intramembrane serine protease n=1 Tax=Georgenia sp. TF02-10 TaxID=2917725 RepID=UPI001FA79DD4|nr:rhomboid family intramembrane serine protease [Georgenia sp. TF02-10]UNX54977.1 rhomboid family intramembrane serine protease [Georgenia sp. TF02-10]
MSHPVPEPTGTTEVPVCPRHPDTVSYVRCQRCGRPACPQCQRPAAVGVQCVDCVNDAARRTPPVRTVLGGRARGGRPVVTLTIIGLCVALYLLQQVLGTALTARLVFAPAVGTVEPYRFLTSAFLHGGVLHLALNMYALWIVGSVLEPALGRWRYIALYLLSAVGGSVTVVLLADPSGLSWVTQVVGASGAVFGLFAAIFFVLRRLGRDATQIVVLIGLNFALGFLVPNIAWQAHLGGAVTGALLAAAYVYAPRQRRTLVSVLATVAVGVLLVAVTVLRYASV